MAWASYEYQPSFVLGFHGCDAVVGEHILRGEGTHLRASEKEYDWLGHGIYFWEGNPARALEWANARYASGLIEHPFVLGAIIDLGHCLDLFDKNALEQIKAVHQELIKTLSLASLPVPQNVGKTPDKLGRRLDCAVFNFLHEYREERQAQSYDSIRGAFLEGEPLYEGAGFRSQNHIQLCLRSAACIKGYFRPIA